MRKRGESGFALLLVFLMAAVIAISLYAEIPRVAFQAQRQKEQLLIERGEQYKRAIQLFVKANGRYPGDLKDLENFNHRRFLRHRFIDPMTGSADWRLIHINGGMLTDSVVTKPKPVDPNQPASLTAGQSSSAGQYVSEIPSIGIPAGGQPIINPALGRRRASEGGAPGLVVGPDGQPIAPDQPATPGGVPSPGSPGAQPTSGAQPSPAGSSLPGFPAVPYPAGTTFLPGASNGFEQPVTGQPVPGQPVPGQLVAGQPLSNQPLSGRIAGGPPASYPNWQAYVGSSQPYVGSSQPYVGGGVYIGSQPTSTNGANPPPGIPGAGYPLTPPAQPAVPNNPGVPGGVTLLPGLQQAQQSADSSGASQTPAPPLPQPGTAGPDPAVSMINNSLTNPQQAPAPAPAGGQQFGGGIAGVASKSESPSIMVYNDRTQYNEWEFIFDMTKQRSVQNPFGNVPGTPAANLGPGFGAPGLPVSPRAAAPGAAPAASVGFGLGLGSLASAPSPASGTSPLGASPAQATGVIPVGMQANGLPLGFRMGRP
ncbi:MAG: hypothetical protein KGM92_17525 [Acidobacteriota bacterium]|nr:hypothetical protein [Acidobacteriota bacterium]